MSYVVIIMFIVGTVAGFSGYSDGSAWWTHISYMFAHVNVLHLILNSVAFFTLFKLLQQIVYKWFLLIIVLSIAFVGSYAASYSIETKGASGIVYALLGIFSWFTLSGKIRFKTDWYYFVFAVGIVAGFLLSLLRDSSNTLLHTVCYLYSMMMFVIIDFTRVKGIYLKRRE